MKILWAYLKEVLVQYKYLLGGGSLLLVLLGVVEHFLANSVRWTVYIWILGACFVIALVRHGVNQYERLIPRIVIRNLTRRVWPVDQHGFTGAEYFFEVYNSGGSQSLENVRVELVSMEPDAIGYLPVPLHIKHDDYESREMLINPGSGRQVDLVTGPVNHPKSQQVVIIAHTVNADRACVPPGKYRLTVRVCAKDTPPVTAAFEAWIEEFELRCVTSSNLPLTPDSLM